MSSKPKVLMIVTLDTKALEAQFVRQTLEAEGVDVVHLDASIRDSTDPNVEIAPEAIAAAAGKTIQEVRDLRHEGKCQAVMIEGAVKCALEAQAKHGIVDIIGVGGSMGTTLGSVVMQAFPYGLPKVMVSTMASGFTRPFVGAKDIIRVNPVCDIAGLNSITRDAPQRGDRHRRDGKELLAGARRIEAVDRHDDARHHSCRGDRRSGLGLDPCNQPVNLRVWCSLENIATPE